MSPERGRTLLGIALATTALLGCQFDAGGLTPPDGAGVDVDPLPDAMAEAGVGPDGGNGCINGVQRCLGVAVEDCEDGEWIHNKDCAWGCGYNGLGYPYCGNALWAEKVDLPDDASDGVWVADQGVTVIYTDDGTIITPLGPLLVDFKVGTHFRSVDIGHVTIIGFAEIQIPNGARVEVVGSQALALVASGSIVIAGELIAQGHSDGTAGPGGYPGGVDGEAGAAGGGGAPGGKSSGAVLRSGAGGGGHTGVGGVGGTVTQILGTMAGGLGGGTVIVEPLDGPLVGGHGGGSTAGDMSNNNQAPGGGGGGALMLAAQISVEVLVTGVVNAGGGGGSSRGAGAGGGSGGMVLIQTHSCVIDGVVAANGGGGGDVNNGAAGAAGSSGDQPTPGGGLYGGAGGAGSDLAGAGGTEGANEFYGGGGGGGAGFIRIDTVLPPDIAMGTISPHEPTAGHAQNSFPIH